MNIVCIAYTKILLITLALKYPLSYTEFRETKWHQRQFSNVITSQQRHIRMHLFCGKSQRQNYQSTPLRLLCNLMQTKQSPV